MKRFSLPRSGWAWMVAVGVAGTAAACGGSTPLADAPPGETEGGEGSVAEAPPAEAPAKKFDEMSDPEKMKYMKDTVRPHMAKVFQEADADAYSNFKCTVCHGPGAKSGNFAMPNDSLPKLNEEEMAEHPEVTKFMAERVVPEMATLLGEEPYNPETSSGEFGCYNCHMRKE